jgi:hypothetical protein
LYDLILKNKLYLGTKVNNNIFTSEDNNSNNNNNNKPSNILKINTDACDINASTTNALSSSVIVQKNIMVNNVNKDDKSILEHQKSSRKKVFKFFYNIYI